MDGIVEKLRERQDVLEICKRHSLSISVLTPVMEHLMQGYNHTEIAQLLGLHRVTVGRYASTLRNMDPQDVQKLAKYVLGGPQHEEDSDPEDG